MRRLTATATERRRCEGGPAVPNTAIAEVKEPGGESHR